MYGIEDYDDGITRHKIGKDEHVYAIFTTPEKESNVDGKDETVETKKGTEKQAVSEDYLEPGSGGGMKFDAVVSEFAGIYGKTASPAPKA